MSAEIWSGMDRLRCRSSKELAFRMSSCSCLLDSRSALLPSAKECCQAMTLSWSSACKAAFICLHAKSNSHDRHCDTSENCPFNTALHMHVPVCDGSRCSIFAIKPCEVLYDTGKGGVKWQCLLRDSNEHQPISQLTNARRVAQNWPGDCSNGHTALLAH